MLRVPVEKTRSPERFVASPLGIKSWREQLPTCAEARPARCPCCDAAARPVSGTLIVVGHGVDERQHLGPLAPGEPPVAATVIVRRYRCRACAAILVVGPAGLVRRRWYSGAAIAAALATYARGASSSAVRAATSPSGAVGPSAQERWITLTRWIDAAQVGKLFGVAGVRGGEDRRRVAEQVAVALAARAGRAFGDDLVAKAFEGAAIAA